MKSTRFGEPGHGGRSSEGGEAKQQGDLYVFCLSSWMTSPYKKLLFSFTAIAMISGTFAADIFVSANGGKNKNPGTKEAPLKNIWKAVEKAVPGDVIHVAEGKYSGKTSCGWIEINKAVSLIGGYSKDFSIFLHKNDKFR